MNHAPLQGSLAYALLALGLAGVPSLSALAGQAKGSASVAAPQAENKASSKTERPDGPWQVFGRVTDQDGKPFAGVDVTAYCGMGTLRNTGVATSRADGRYELSFGPGMVFTRGDGTSLQVATISAHKPGYFEENLNRQGGCLAAEKLPGEDAIKRWGSRKDRVFLPDRPMELNFVMRPAVRVAGKLIDEQGQPLAGYGVGLIGPDNPPSMGAVRGTQADKQGRFSLEDIPTTFRFQFTVGKAVRQYPWDDSWASGALRFENPDRGDLRAWFGDREIRIQEFEIRIEGPGAHHQTATPIAGNAGVLNLTAVGPSDVLERNAKLLVAKSAVLTLRNSPRQDLSRSLITESVPAAPAYEPTTRLTRTRPNQTGEFTISFENPRDCDLEPGKHQVIFQVFVGASQKPIRQKIFRQLEVLRAGRYQVPVKIPPEWIDDSSVSITFLSIQPDHAAWLKSFFQDGKGTKYSGIWTGDGGVMPAIPFDRPR
jgi:hypothetical protein